MLFGRRVGFTLIILASQLLLVALAITLLIQMLIIARNGSVRFIESNPGILIAEIIVLAFISLFGIAIFILQILRLREKRKGDDTRNR